MFEAELLGLNLLRATETICLPKPVCAGASEDKTFLILEFVSSAPKSGDYWTDFGQRLAELHQQSNPFFGLNHDNYIGSLPQSNTQLASLTEFMITQRFEPLVRQSREQGLVEKGLVLQFEKLYHRLEHLIPDEKPALLHGDLWSGNVMTAHDGAVCLIDPAVFYGHREAELAFTTLFGAFPQEFYEAYHFSFPLEQDWKQRIDLWNIYPLLVHLLLFGSSYYSQISSIVRKYI